MKFSMKFTAENVACTTQKVEKTATQLF